MIMEENNQKLRKCAKVVKYASWSLAGAFALMGLIFAIMWSDAATLVGYWLRGGLTFLFGYIMERMLLILADIEENTRQNK